MRPHIQLDPAGDPDAPLASWSPRRHARPLFLTAGAGLAVVVLAVAVLEFRRAMREERYYGYEMEKLRRELDEASWESGRAYALERIGRTHRKAESRRAALRCLQEALEIHERHGREWAVADVLLGIGHVHFEAGRMNLAEAAYREALEIAERLDLPVAVSLARCGLGGVALMRGELDEAEAYYRPALEFEANFEKVMELLWSGRGDPSGKERCEQLVRGNPVVPRTRSKDVRIKPDPEPVVLECGTGMYDTPPSLRERRMGERGEHGVLTIDEEFRGTLFETRAETAARLHWNVAILHERKGDLEAARRQLAQVEWNSSWGGANLHHLRDSLHRWMAALEPPRNRHGGRP